MSNFAEERMVICNSCEYNMDSQCILCGCPLLSKTSDPEESCPLNQAKWIALSKKIVPKADVESVPVQVPTLESTAPTQQIGCIPCQSKTR